MSCPGFFALPSLRSAVPASWDVPRKGDRRGKYEDSVPKEPEIATWQLPREGESEATDYWEGLFQAAALPDSECTLLLLSLTPSAFKGCVFGKAPGPA